MQFSVERTGTLERKITVQIPFVDVEGQIKQRLVSISRRAKIAGFRPGKVPMSVVENMYGPQVRGEVIEELTNKGIQEAVKKEGLNPAGPADVAPINLETGKDYEFVATLEEFPKVDVQGLESLAINRPIVEVTDADVDDVVLKLRTQRAPWQATGRGIQNNDRVEVSMRANPRSGDTLPDSVTAERTFTVIVGAKNNWAPLDERLQGTTAGAVIRFEHAFPADHFDTVVAGKTVDVEATVLKVEEPLLPALDAEFVKAFGVESGDVADLRAEVRKDMQKEASRAIHQQVKSQLLDQLCASNPVEVPQVLLKQEMTQIRDSIRQSNGDQFLATMEANDAAGLEQTARKNVAIGLLMRTLIESNKIAVSRDRVKAKIEEVAAQYEDPDMVRQHYYKDRNALRQLEVSVLEEQVLELLQSKAAVTDKVTPFSDVISRA